MQYFVFPKSGCIHSIVPPSEVVSYTKFPPTSVILTFALSNNPAILQFLENLAEQD
jgi:hypothetical protein